MSKNEEIFLDKLKEFKLNIGAFTQPYEIAEPKEAPKRELKEVC